MLTNFRKNKAGYTAICRVWLGRGSNAQKSTKTLRKKNGGPTDGPTDGRTDGQTDTPSYRVACTRLKIIIGHGDECVFVCNVSVDVHACVDEDA